MSNFSLTFNKLRFVAHVSITWINELSFRYSMYSREKKETKSYQLNLNHIKYPMLKAMT